MKQSILFIALFLIAYSGISQTTRSETTTLDTTQLNTIDSIYLYSFYPELSTIYQNKIITVSLCAGAGVFAASGVLINTYGTDTHNAHKLMFALSGACALLAAIVEITNIVQIKHIRNKSSNILFTPNGVIVKF